MFCQMLELGRQEERDYHEEVHRLKRKTKRKQTIISEITETIKNTMGT